ncbi:hypothetical protein QJS10_CPA01g00873 [Acorus calamus]|uniref:Uncharacterized protein n=1 Tax=Acorus calamus TaxID=4465 RepID=A0AAV9FR07_ACOCL|nr:hypothetical protein QJS10_CPA01g00873 [Acorus calamus]
MRPPLPFHDRASVSILRDPPCVAFNHREIEFKNDTVIRYSAEFMRVNNPLLIWARFKLNLVQVDVDHGRTDDVTL